MFKKILVPTDGSELSQEAVSRAISFASEAGAHITFFCAEKRFPLMYFGADAIFDSHTPTRFHEEVDSVAQGIVDAAEQIAQAAGVPCNKLVLESEEPYEGIIEAAERFGLAQLHQLRGRVGRGTAHSVCLLLRGADITETARARLALMRQTNDGFRIAEEDLRLRGAGEMLGHKQSGEPEFKLADLDRMTALLPIARDDARLLLDRDGGLDSERGRAARVLLYLFERDSAVALLRSG